MNELQPKQGTFNYFALDADVAIEARAAAERIKIRLRRTAEDIVEIGRELVEIKNKLTHGQFLPWVEAEFEMSLPTATRFMQTAERFGGKFVNLTNLKPSILYMLAAPSTPEEVIEKATEKAEAGEKVSVEDVKRWKAEAEHAHRQAKELQICAMQNQEKAENLRESLEAAQLKIEELSSQEPKVITETVTKEIIPEDYALTKDELAAARKDLDAVVQELRSLKQKQAQEVSKGVQDAIKLHEKELKDIEAKRDHAERRLEELKQHIESLGKKATVHKFHDSMIGEWEHELIELAVQIAEFEYIPETHDKWLRLAKNFTDAGQAIELLIAEKSGRSLNDRPDTSRDYAGQSAEDSGN
jgi:hypothetical protein